MYPLPKNLIDALNGHNWEVTMKYEYDALLKIRCGTWFLVCQMLILFKDCGFSSIRRIMIDLLSDTKLIPSVMVQINKLVLIMGKPSTS